LADEQLLSHFGKQTATGITLTASGFYGPQGRVLRLPTRFNHQHIDALATWQGPNDERITNLEMETAGIYGLANALGHRAVSLNALLANRATGAFSQDPKRTVESLISWGLEQIIASSV
ncbi:MAG: phosphorylase, partial [Bacteroidota bacterium]